MDFKKYCKVYYKTVIVSLVAASFIVAFPAAKAGVYKCIDENGAIEFCDAPCRTNAEAQEFLPIVYSKSNAKNIKKQQKTLEKNLKQHEIAEGKQQRLAIRTEKQRQKIEDKEKRRQEHCSRVKEKITVIEDQLRSGSKVKRFNRLKAELEHCERMKLRYCGPQ